MSLKAIIGQKIMDEVVKNSGVGSGKQGGSANWKILVVDQPSMRMVSACCKMHDLAEHGVTLVEDINKRREPLPHLDAIYLLQPSLHNIHLILSDFCSRCAIYRSAYIYFTARCPDECFNQLSHETHMARYVRALAEVNMAVMPLESQIYSLDVTRDVFACVFGARNSGKQQALSAPEIGASAHSQQQKVSQSRSMCLERMAEQLATLCVTLNEYPSVRYRASCDITSELAQLVQQKLDGYKADEPTLGDSAEKAKSQLLIIDRSFDCVSPILHELTFQCMAYDLLSIENDVYCYEASTGDHLKEVLLDENDDLWADLRHKHIALVSNEVTKKMKQFIDSKRGVDTDKASMRDLGQMIKKMPQHQKELSKYSTHLHLAEECMVNYTKDIDALCKVEQDLATGITVEGEKVRDHMRVVLTVMMNEKLSVGDKMRALLLYVLVKNGATEENLSKLFQHANIPPEERCVLNNLVHIGLNWNADVAKNKKVYQVPRKKRISEQTFQTARWTPVLKDVIEDLIDLKLDDKHFPYLSTRLPSSCVTARGGGGASSTARYSHWHKSSAQQAIGGAGVAPARNVPRVIVFVLGGLTYSEMRVAYEVASTYKNFDIFVGGDHLITPSMFINNLKSLSTDT